MAQTEVPHEQPQQAADAARAPTSAHEAAAPRIERPAPKREDARRFTDWASI